MKSAILSFLGRTAVAVLNINFGFAFGFHSKHQNRCIAQRHVRKAWLRFRFCRKYFKHFHNFFNLYPWVLSYVFLLKFISSLSCKFKCFTSFLCLIQYNKVWKQARFCIIDGQMYCLRHGPAGSQLPDTSLKTITLFLRHSVLDAKPNFIHIEVYNLHSIFHGTLFRHEQIIERKRDSVCCSRKGRNFLERHVAERWYSSCQMHFL